MLWKNICPLFTVSSYCLLLYQNILQSHLMFGHPAAAVCFITLLFGLCVTMVVTLAEGSGGRT